MIAVCENFDFLWARWHQCGAIEFELLSRDTRPQMKSSSSWPKDFHAAASYNFLQLLGPKISKNCQREAVLCSCPDMRHQQTNCAHGSSSHLRHHRLLARKLHVDAGVEVCLLVATRTVTSHAAMVSLQHVGAAKNTPSSHRPSHWANAPVWKACPFGCTPDDAAILRFAMKVPFGGGSFDINFRG